MNATSLLPGARRAQHVFPHKATNEAGYRASISSFLARKGSAPALPCCATSRGPLRTYSAERQLDIASE
jgi:hypothetical protein